MRVNVHLARIALLVRDDRLGLKKAQAQQRFCGTPQKARIRAICRTSPVVGESQGKVRRWTGFRIHKVFFYVLLEAICILALPLSHAS